MMKGIAKKPLFWFLLVIVASVFSFNSLIRPGYFPMHDDMQAMRVLQMDKCVKDGQIPCRWVPDMGYGYGYPQFNYYPPLPYYVMELIHLGGFSILDSVKAGFAVSFALSAISMFILGRSLFGNVGGFISSLFYVYAPYRATNVFNRGAVGEVWAFIFLPLIFWSILEIVRKGKSKYIVYLALSYAGLLTTHLLTSLIFSPVALVWGI
ncbi:glycosyltransferase family 39 protein, partial [Patescibacteria group bacterium]|nr:glycosyltransferase family 39 protein [Patescibacteria group bacterium]